MPQGRSCRLAEWNEVALGQIVEIGVDGHRGRSMMAVDHRATVAGHVLDDRGDAARQQTFGRGAAEIRHKMRIGR